MKTNLTAMLVLVLVAGFAVAQPGPTHAQMKPMQGMMPGMNQTPQMPQMSGDQLDKMDAQRISLLREVDPIKTSLAVAQVELVALWRAETLDSKKILAKVSEVDALKAKLDIAMANYRIAMHNLMTPEQRKAMRGSMGAGMMGSMPCMTQGCPMMNGGTMGSGMMQGCPMMGGGMMQQSEETEGDND